MGALIIKQRLKCSDEWTVRHVSENPYLQYFLGLKEYTSKCPFGASTMVEFRKRFPPEAIAALLVSISQPWVRPIVRGKAHANTEFGAKLHISMVDGYAKIERLSFNAFNEATDFFSAVEGYRQEHGCYPQRILVDKIYRNRETISWCKAQGIQLTGPALGRPAKNAERTKQAKKQEYQDICDRNIVEGEFVVGKRSYGLNRIMARLQETSFCVIGIALLCMNLAKRLRALLHYFLRIWFLSAPSPVFAF